VIAAPATPMLKATLYKLSAFNIQLPPKTMANAPRPSHVEHEIQDFHLAGGESGDSADHHDRDSTDKIREHGRPHGAAGRSMKRQVSGMITAPTITPPTTADTVSPKDMPVRGARARMSFSEPCFKECHSISKHTNPSTERRPPKRVDGRSPTSVSAS